MYRQFTVKDAEGKVIKFKVWPNLASPNTNRMAYEKMEIELTLETNDAMLSLVEVCNKFMNENSINKLVVDEIEET